MRRQAFIARQSELPTITMLFAAVHESGCVQVFGRRHDEGYPRAAAAGVQKAPRHEIAGSGAPAVPRALMEI